MRIALAGLVLAGAVGTAYAAGAPGKPAPTPPGAGAPRPAITQDRIPFPRKRKAEMRRYARRHYRLSTYRLRDPKVIVEHFTGSESYRSAYATFAADVPDVELHELPGLCAHFVIDKAGVIHQLVSLRIMCRHTVGLNWTAIGIEHVGTSDREILGNRAQLRASLRLTRWLQGRFGILRRNVIGHSESLRSPYHRERVPALAHQTHGDFSRASMRIYRRRLGRSQTARSPKAVRRRVRLGRSVRGRPIDALERGDPGAAMRVLVVGAIHGDEPAGVRLAHRLARGPVPSGLDLWVVDDLNPDGAAAHTRQNARGVDLNRNFPRHWRPVGRRGDRYFSGPKPLSEPETRIARRLIRRVRPRITIWLHQPYALVNRSGGDVAIERRFAELAGLPLGRLGPYPGTATSWQNDRFPGTTAFVVELPPGPLGSRRVARYRRAVLEIGREASRRPRLAFGDARDYP